MAGYPISNDTLQGRISALNERIKKLEHPKNIAHVEQLCAMQIADSGLWDQGVIIPDSQYGDILYSSKVVKGNNVLYGYQIGFNPGILEFRYYQETPQKYTDAEIAAGTNYIVLDTNSVPGDFFPYTQEFYFSDELRGTFGRMGLTGYCNPGADSFGMQVKLSGVTIR